MQGRRLGEQRSVPGLSNQAGSEHGAIYLIDVTRPFTELTVSSQQRIVMNLDGILQLRTCVSMVSWDRAPRVCGPFPVLVQITMAALTLGGGELLRDLPEIGRQLVRLP